MAKEPLITRSSLRQHRENKERNQEVDTQEQPQNVTRIAKVSLTREQPLIKEQPQRQPENPGETRKKASYGFYRKKAKEPKPLNKSRSVENQKSRELNGFLMRSIVVVCLLIVVVMLATFFL